MFRGRAPRVESTNVDYCECRSLRAVDTFLEDRWARQRFEIDLNRRLRSKRTVSTIRVDARKFDIFIACAARGPSTRMFRRFPWQAERNVHRFRLNKTVDVRRASSYGRSIRPVSTEHYDLARPVGNGWKLAFRSTSVCKPSNVRSPRTARYNNIMHLGIRFADRKYNNTSYGTDEPPHTDGLMRFTFHIIQWRWRWR